jgi:hypothetical protein
MPGIEKRIARFPQFYSRIGFVHEFRPLDAAQVQNLLIAGFLHARRVERLRAEYIATINGSWPTFPERVCRC